MDRVRWRQDLIEDRNRLATLLSAAKQVGAARDAELWALREVIERKCRQPLNAGNRKLLVFTAFADTAQYLYHELSGWAHKELGLHSALVTGGGHNQTTLPHLRKDFASITWKSGSWPAGTRSQMRWASEESSSINRIR